MGLKDLDTHLLVSALITAASIGDTKAAAEAVWEVMDLHPAQLAKAIYLLAVHVGVAHARACELVETVLTDHGLTGEFPTPETFRRKIAEEIISYSEL
jgi:hypothetical protein